MSSARVSVSVRRLVATAPYENASAEVSFAVDCDSRDRAAVVEDARRFALAELARTVAELVPLNHPEASEARRERDALERQAREAQEAAAQEAERLTREAAELAVEHEHVDRWRQWERDVEAFRAEHPQAHRNDAPRCPEYRPRRVWRTVDSTTRARWLRMWDEDHGDPDADIPF